MLETWKKKQSKRRLLIRSDDFNQDVKSGDAANIRQQNVAAIDGTVAREVIAKNSDSDLRASENTVDVQTWERCFKEMIDREMSKTFDTVENRIPNAVSTAIDNINTPCNDLAVRSINASSGPVATSITLSSGRGEPIGITASFENVCTRKNTFHELSANDETQKNIPDMVNYLLVPETLGDRQSHSHHRNTPLFLRYSGVNAINVNNFLTKRH